eukprot:363471-Chlamydomonas_euryale.AAC.7
MHGSHTRPEAPLLAGRRVLGAASPQVLPAWELQACLYRGWRHVELKLCGQCEHTRLVRGLEIVRVPTCGSPWQCGQTRHARPRHTASHVRVFVDASSIGQSQRCD